MYEVAGSPILAFVLDPRQKVFGQLVGASSLVGKMPASMVYPDTLMPEISRMVHASRRGKWHELRLRRELSAYFNENIQRVRGVTVVNEGERCVIRLVTADDLEEYDYLLEVQLDLPHETSVSPRR